ncbi:MAG: hypothetical protein CM15mP2_4360 [Methanobacteriota archaeon]|nr:MAG: hypothetical protein CM15mP2_4360 [Euryarchaeota archaeon]
MLKKNPQTVKGDCIVKYITVMTCMGSAGGIIRGSGRFVMRMAVVSRVLGSLFSHYKMVVFSTELERGGDLNDLELLHTIARYIRSLGFREKLIARKACFGF